MANLRDRDFSIPQKGKYLIGFADWKGFVGFSKGIDSIEVFDYLNKFYEICGEVIEPRGGMIIKYLVDACLSVFPEDLAENGVLAHYELQSRVEDWFHQEGIKSKLSVNCHFGELTIGMMGHKGHEVVDVIGQQVNTCVTLGKDGFVMSPQAFRCLSAENRKGFRKYTPPITYHPVSNPR